jgi:hypothetical protein
MVRYVLMDKKTNKVTKYSWFQWQIAFFLLWASGIVLGLAISTKL